jgi:hypothetical protein
MFGAQRRSINRSFRPRHSVSVLKRRSFFPNLYLFRLERVKQRKREISGKKQQTCIIIELFARIFKFRSPLCSFAPQRFSFRAQTAVDHRSFRVHIVILIHEKVKQSRYTPLRRLGERRYSSYSFTTSAEVGWVVSVTPGRTLPPGNVPRYPLYRRLGGPQSRSGHWG